MKHPGYTQGDADAHKYRPDDELLERARQLTGLRTKRAIVHEALRALVQIHEQATVRALRGKLKWEGDLHQQRFSRVENDDASGG